MGSTFIKNMKKVSESEGLDEDLVAIVDEGAERTSRELQVGAKDNEKFRQFLTLQSTIAENADRFLSESTTTFEKFKALLKNPSTTGSQRFLKAVSLGLYKPDLTQNRVSTIILDLYNNQVQHKGAVGTSLDLLKNRRKLIYDIAEEAAIDIRDHASGYNHAKIHLDRIVALQTVLKSFTEDTGDLSYEDLKHHIVVCTESGLYEGGELVNRMEAGEDIKPDLYLVKNDVDRVVADIDDLTRDEGLRAKGGVTLLQGLDLQKDQFQETVKGMSVQHTQLDVDLHYTKQLARNTFYLMQAQEISHDALDAFMAYRDVMSETQLFNSLGARLMLDRVGFLMVTPFFDQDKMEEAKYELQEAAGMFSEKDKQFHEGVRDLVKKLGIEEIHTGYQ